MNKKFIFLRMLRKKRSHILFSQILILKIQKIPNNYWLKYLEES